MDIVKKTVGLNLGRENIVLSEISFAAEKATLERIARTSLIKDKPVGQQIKTLFQDLKLDGNSVRVSLKGQGIVVRYLNFPKMSRADFASSIQFEAEKYLPFSLSDVVLDYHLLDASAASAETMRVILVAVRKTEIERLLATSKEAGIKLHVIDLDIFALVNTFCHAHQETKSSSVALIDLGAADTTLAILNQGNLIFSRDIAFAGNDFTESIRRKLNISEEEALKIQQDSKIEDPAKKSAIDESLERLFQELSSSLTYFYDQHQDVQSIETIYISGGFSQLSLLDSLLEKQLQAPVKKWSPTDGLVFGPSINQDELKKLEPYLPVSIGLALRPR